MTAQDDAIATGADSDTETDSTATADSDSTEFKLSIEVSVDNIGPCKRHVRITVPRADVAHVQESEVDELVSKAEIPGFRPGHVPKNLIKKRLRKELDEKVRNRLLMDSLELLSEEKHLDPINEPNLDVENIEIPEDGDFEYEFDVEVRPEFDVPEYAGLKIRRPVTEITDSEIDEFLDRYLSQYGLLEASGEAAQPGDYVTMAVEFTHGGQPLRKLSDLTVQVKPVLRFSDAELSGFDELIDQAAIGDSREADLTISSEAESIEMRGESVHAVFKVKSVRRMKMPEINSALLSRIGVETEEELRDEIRDMLERQAVYQQRQAVREQVLDKITESADWELPEDLVLSQVENALRREVLEMQQAGFTTQEIQARENELKQNAISTTRKALKEHFVLDKIAEQENIEVDSQDISSEISLMAMQRGESPRRVRAKLMKSGMVENLEAQIRERKAVDVILDRAEFEDFEPEVKDESGIEAVPHSVCGLSVETESEESGEPLDETNDEPNEAAATENAGD